MLRPSRDSLGASRQVGAGIRGGEWSLACQSARVVVDDSDQRQRVDEGGRAQ
jgi:hypothetical protein